MHIIPLQYKSDPNTRPARPAKDEADEDFGAPDSLEAYLSVKDALSLLCDDRVPTQTEERVEKAAFGRVVKLVLYFVLHDRSNRRIDTQPRWRSTFTELKLTYL